MQKERKEAVHSWREQRNKKKEKKRTRHEKER